MKRDALNIHISFWFTLMVVYWAEALVVASKEIILEADAEKTKYMVMSRDQNAGQNINIQIGNKSFERGNSSDVWEQL